MYLGMVNANKLIKFAISFVKLSILQNKETVKSFNWNTICTQQNSTFITKLQVINKTLRDKNNLVSEPSSKNPIKLCR